MQSTKKFIGTDACLETSLFEYQVIAKPYFKDGAKDEYFCIYNQNGLFATGYIKESDLDQLVSGNDWMSNKDVSEFIEFVGGTKEEWFELEFIHKLSDLLNYYGSENIFGTDYSPMTEKEIRKLYKF
jgi:hypothetical protein